MKKTTKTVKEEMIQKINELESLRESKRLPKYYSINDLKIMFQCDTKTIRNLLEEGKIHFFKVGRLIRFDPEDVQNYIRYHSNRSRVQLTKVNESLELENKHLEEL